MKQLTENKLEMAFMFEVKDAELREQQAIMDNVNNLNYDSMAIRCAGHKASRLAFVLGAKYAMAQMKETLQAAERLESAFDKWYEESSHLCNLLDAMKSKADPYKEKTELEHLTALLNASIHYNAVTKQTPKLYSEPESDNVGLKPCTCEDYPCCGH